MRLVCPAILLRAEPLGSSGGSSFAASQCEYQHSSRCHSGLGNDEMSGRARVGLLSIAHQEVVEMDSAAILSLLDGDPHYDWSPLPGAVGATDHELEELHSWFGRPMPDDYVAFLRLANGAEVR